MFTYLDGIQFIFIQSQPLQNCSLKQTSAHETRGKGRQIGKGENGERSAEEGAKT